MTYRNHPSSDTRRNRDLARHWHPDAGANSSLRRRLMAVLRLSCRVPGFGRGRGGGLLGAGARHDSRS
ncbi:hypothetical protein, partial [Sinorhizobium meliloti]